MSDNQYYGAWVKKYIYSKIELNNKKYYLNIEQTFIKQKDTSPDYRITINGNNENTFGAWIKENENGKRIYGKITLGNTQYHMNIFTNERKEKKSHPDYNISIIEV